MPPGPLTAEFRLAPDLFFWPRSGAQLDLDYRYPVANWLDRRASRLDLSINNQYLQTLPLASSWWGAWWEENGAVSHTSRADLMLPSYNLFGQNRLTFDYNLILANMQRCQGRVPDNVRVSILPTSRIDLSGAYHALRMPDLSTFVGGGYPFTVQPDLAETAVIMPGDAGTATVETFLALMGRFGDSTGTPVTRTSVMRQADPQRLRAKDILVIGPAALAGSSTLFESAPVRFEQDRLRVIAGGMIERGAALFSDRDRDTPDEVNELLYRTDHFSGMVGFQSPFDAGRSVIAVLATDTGQLPGMIQNLDDVDVLADVQGDLSLVSGDGMTSFAVGPEYWVGSLPWWVSVGYWFSRHPLLLALSGLLVALVVAGPIYALLRRQQRRRLLDTED